MGGVAKIEAGKPFGRSLLRESLVAEAAAAILAAANGKDPKTKDGRRRARAEVN